MPIKPRKPKYSDEYMIEALRKLDEGKSVPEVAPAFGMNVSTLYRAYRKALDGMFPGYMPTRLNAVDPNRTFTDEFKIGVVKRIEAGETASQVARDIGVHRQTVQEWWDKLRDPSLDPVRLTQTDADKVVNQMEEEEAEEQRLQAEAEHHREQQVQTKQQRINQMVADPLVWMQKHTETRDSHWRENGASSPYRAFPDYTYLRTVMDGLLSEPYVFIEKSRDMMISWLCVGYFTHAAMTVPGIDVAFQTQKEDKAFELVSYAKTLYERQKPELQEAFALEKSLKGMADGELLFANGSRIIGIPGGADQIRSYHPWGLLMDEAAFMPEAGDSYNNALPVSKKIVVVSSAGPGWFADTVRDTMELHI